MPRVFHNVGRDKDGNEDQGGSGYVVRYEDWRTAVMDGRGVVERSGIGDTSLGEGGEDVCYANGNGEGWTRRRSRNVPGCGLVL